jgi:quinol monooxygenase YgiN
MEWLKITIEPLPAKRDELFKACQMISEETRHEKGCFKCRIRRDIDGSNRLIFEQQWQDQYQLESYFQSKHFTAMLGAMKFLGRSYQVTLNDGTPEEGLESVKKARQD